MKQLTPVLIGLAIATGITWSAATQAVSLSVKLAPTSAPRDTLTDDDYMSLGDNAQPEGRSFKVAQYFRYALYLNPEDRAAIIADWNARDALNNGAASTRSFEQ